MGKKAYVAFWGALAGLTGSGTPEHIKELTNVMAIFIVLDTLAGVWLAFVEKRARSRSASEMLVSKLVQYTLLLGVCTGANLLAHTWYWLSAGLLGIVGIESLSLLETATKLQAYGVPLGPLQPLIARLSKYLAAGTLSSEGDSRNAVGK